MVGRRTQFQRLLRSAASPIVFALGVTLLSFHLKGAVWPYLRVLARSRPTELLDGTQLALSVLAGGIFWATAMLVLYVLLVAGIAASGWVICVSIPKGKEAVRFVPLAVISIAVAVAWFHRSGDFADVAYRVARDPDICSRPNLAVVCGSFEAAKKFLAITNTLAFTFLVTLTLAFAAIVQSLSSEATPDVITLRRAKSRMALMLYLGTALLAAAAVEIFALLIWQGSVFPTKLRGPLETVAASTAFLAGAFFTLFLGSVFIPTAVTLSSAIERTVSERLQVDPSQPREDFLKEHLLSTSSGELLRRAAAIFGPVLAGVVGGPFGQLLINLSTG